MRLLPILIAAVATAAVAADTASVKLVFSGHSAVEYNQWLHQHAAEYPGLQPIHVQIDSEVAGDSERYSYYVSFLDDTGVVIRSRTFTGTRDESRAMIEAYDKWLEARTSCDGNVLFLSPGTDVVTVYDRSGDSLFTSTEGLIDGAGELYFRQFVDDEGDAYRDYYDVLDGRGQVLSKIALGGTGEGEGLKTNHPFVYSRDTTYVMHAGSFVSVINKHGNVLWQTTPKYWTAVAISDDGRTVAVATPASLVTKHLDSGLTSTVEFPEGKILDSLWATGSHGVPSGGYYAPPKVALNGDGSRMAVFRPYNIWSPAGHGLLDVFEGDGTSVCRNVSLAPGMVRAMGFAGDRVVFVGDAVPARDSLAESFTGRPRKPSNMFRLLITEANLSDSVSATEVTVERSAVPTFASSAVAFHGKDSIYVYRIGTAPTQRK